MVLLASDLMNAQTHRADRFRVLHESDSPLILPNVWDPLGAAIVAEAGFPAVATASAAVALSRGFDDGEQIPFDELVELVHRISAVIELPVSVDFEKGYGVSPEDVRYNTLRLIAAGAVGVNVEDSLDHDRLREVGEQCERIAAVRDAADEAGVGIFINARTDTFLTGAASAVEEAAVSRLAAYRDAGADGVYPILCEDLGVLSRIHAATKRPVNVLLRPSAPPVPALVKAGVRRISLGPELLSLAAGAIHSAVQRMASEDLGLGDLPHMTTGEMRRLLGL